VSNIAMLAGVGRSASKNSSIAPTQSIWSPSRSQKTPDHPRLQGWQAPSAQGVDRATDFADAITAGADMQKTDW
jgi:hypothetical protein